MSSVQSAAIASGRPAPRATLRRPRLASVHRFLLPAVLVLMAAPAFATQLLRVTPADKTQFLQLQLLVPELRDCGATSDGRSFEFATEEGRAAELSALGYAVEIAVPDLESFYASRLQSRDDFGLYHTYPEAIAAMDALMAAHPTIMSKRSIGTTIEGRPIWVYMISDNTGIHEDEPQIFFNAYIHAREVITFEVVYDLAAYLVNGYGSDPRATALVDSREIFIQPVVNPDGLEYNRQTNPAGGGMWRKNRRDNGDGSIGVDLNRNFSEGWGADDVGSSPVPSAETYRGVAPFSEPESAALRDFVVAHRFKTAINLHACGGYHLFAPGFGRWHTYDYDTLLELGRMRRGAAGGYATGPVWEILYDANGDANDWMILDELSKPKILSLGTEVGTSTDGFWPAESRIPALCAENLEPNLRMIELADNPLRVLLPGLAVITAPDTVSSSFALTWAVPHPDVDNPAVAWNLIEASGPTAEQDSLEESVQDRWTADGWTWSTGRYHSAGHSFYSGNANNLNNVLVSRRGHLVKPGDQLKFWTWYRIEWGRDFGYVEVATDARRFTAIPGSITTNDNPYQRNVGFGISGNSPGWTQATFDLSGYVGQVIWVRFQYSTDGYTAMGGWYVDDIEPSGLFATETPAASNVGEAQYTFQDHPLGTFSFLVQSIDAEGQVSAWGSPKELFVTAPAGAEEIAAAGRWRGLELRGANPVRGEARLGFTVPASARVGDPLRLSVHDVTGRSVAVLRDESIGDVVSPGRVSEDRLDVSTLPAGLYLARLEVGALVSERKVIVIK
jgi:hypothetical protein